MNTPIAYDAIVPWYNLEHGNVTDDIDLYRNFAEGAGSPILEIGCGSGRILLPLAQAGYDMTGIDTSSAMLAACQQHAATAKISVTLLQQSMTELALPRHDYRMAFIALGTFQHLATVTDRRETLQRLRQHVIAGATLILDITQSEPRRFQQLAQSGQIVHIGTWSDGEAGHIVTHTVAARIGAEPATLALTHWYDVYQQGGTVQRTCIETTLAEVSLAEMVLLLTATGWRLRQTFGDHDMESWDNESNRLIIIAQAAE